MNRRARHLVGRADGNQPAAKLAHALGSQALVGAVTATALGPDPAAPPTLINYFLIVIRVATHPENHAFRKYGVLNTK